MRVFRSLSAIRVPRKRPVVTLGVFDGVHVGHARILKRAVRLAASRRTASVAITFKGHPDDVLRSQRQASITSLPHRLELMEALGLAAEIRLDHLIAGLAPVRLAIGLAQAPRSTDANDEGGKDNQSKCVHKATPFTCESV